MLKQLFKEIFKQKGIFLLLFIWVLDQICMVSLPYFGKIFIEFIENWNINSEFYFYLSIAVVAWLGWITFWFFSNYIKSWIATNFEISKNIYYFKRFFNLDFEYRTSEWTWKTITKINRWIDSQVSLFNTIIEAILILWVRASLILFAIFMVYKSLIVFIVVLCLALLFLSKYIWPKVKILTNKEQEISELIWRQTNKMIMESGLIKVSNREQFEINKLKEIFSTLPKIRQNILLFNNITYDLMHLAFQIAEFSCYLIIWMLIIKSQMTIWELFLILSYIWWLWRPISVIINNASEYRNQISKYEALELFVNQKNAIVDWHDNYQLSSWTIEFKNVSFGYDSTKTILNDLSLRFEWWKTTALVWHSWSWKSTIIKLLLRNYLPTNWEILLDWQNSKVLQIGSFYQHVWYLSQEPAVFDWNIRENLEYSRNSSIDESELRDALRQVDLYDLIKNCKDWLNTEIGEKWLKLSGWEKQRLAIARIFLKNPKILILDEPTSALDSISEHKITTIINNVMRNRTVIVIAHRLQTVLSADKIVVLEKGKIIEAGTHNELLKNKWTYSELVDLQRGIINE